MKIIFLSDLHISNISKSEHSSLNRLFERVQRLSPNYIIFGGDTVEYNISWEEFFSFYRRIIPNIFTSVILGNHDFWSHGLEKTRENIYDSVYNVCKSFNINFLEECPIIHDDTLLCGTSAWYDYSAYEKDLTGGLLFEKEYFIYNKKIYNNDGNYINSKLSDIEYSELCNKRLLNIIKKYQKEVSNIVVFTHIPLLIECKSDIPMYYDKQQWKITNSYFYNFTLGNKLKKNKKVKLLASGHTHCYKAGTLLSGLRYVVSGSDYNKPKIVIIDIDKKNCNIFQEE